MDGAARHWTALLNTLERADVGLAADLGAVAEPATRLQRTAGKSSLGSPTRRSWIAVPGFGPVRSRLRWRPLSTRYGPSPTGGWNLHREVRLHDGELDRLTQQQAPELRAAFGVGPDTAAELLIVAGDNPRRVRSEAAFAALCGVAPLPASSGQTTRHRRNRGGHRHANAALYRVVIVRMRWHPPTLAFTKRRLAEGKTKAEIIRCLKRYVAREAFRHLLHRCDVDASPPAA
jgi:Transposase IS116/IS110/IS902 family